MSATNKKSFGAILQKLRKQNGLSIKKLGSELDINYSYISKLENDKTVPSNDFVSRVATFFSYDTEELLLRAGKIPDDIVDILSNNPKEAVKFLRNKFNSNE